MLGRTAMLRGLGLSVATAAMLAAAPALAATMTVSDIVLDADLDVVLTLPTLEAVDANLDEAAIRALFTAPFDDADRAALSELTATSITIPELQLTPKPGSEADDGRHIVITGVTLENVANGLAGTASIGSVMFDAGINAEAKAEGDSESVVIDLTQLDTSGFDIGNVLRLLMAAAGAEEIAADAPAETPAALFQTLSLAAATAKSGNGTCAIGPLTMDAFAMRPPRTIAAPEDETPEAAEVREEVNGLEVLTAIEAGPMSIASVDCDVVSDEGDPIAITTGALTAAGLSPGQLPEVTTGTVRIDNANEGWVEIVQMLLRPIDYSDLVAFYEAQRGDADPLIFESAPERVRVTNFGGFALSGISLDVPNEDDPAQRIVGSIGAVDLSFGDYLNGLPTSISASGDDIHFLIPKNAETEPMMAALGIDAIDFDYASDARWDSAAQTIVLDGLTIDARSLAAVTIKSTLGNATESLFDLDESVAMQATEGLTLKELHIDITDAGLLDVAIATIAAEQGIEPAQFRAAFGTMAQGTVMMGLGASGDALAVAQAVNTFIASGGSISLTATALDPAGVTLEQFQAAEDDPTSLAALFKITAVVPETPASAVTPAAEAPAAEAPAQKAPADKTKN